MPVRIQDWLLSGAKQDYADVGQQSPLAEENVGDKTGIHTKGGGGEGVSCNFSHTCFSNSKI